MRDIGSALLAAQRADTTYPYVKVYINSHALTNTYVKYAQQVERPYGGTAIIRIDNSDNDEDDTDYRGEEVRIQWGLDDSDGVLIGTSETQSYWVYSSREVSIEGEKLLELFCIDTWHKLGFLKVGVGGVQLTGTAYGDLVPGRKVKGSTSDATGVISHIAEDKSYIYLTNTSGTFVDTENAVDTQDAANYLDISAVTNIGAGGPAPGWDGNTNIDDIIGNDATAGTLLYGTEIDIDVDSSDRVIDAYKPIYFTSSVLRPPTIRSIIKDLIGMTKCGFRIEDDEKLHVFDLSSTPSPADYTYTLQGTHDIFKNMKDLSLIIPNRIIAYCIKQDSTGAIDYVGTAADAAEAARFIAITDYISCNVTSDAQATALAEATLHRIQWNSQSGTIEVPMNIGQELFDYVTVTDSRMGVTYNGYVGGITRTWEHGTYKMVLEFGGLEKIQPIEVEGEGRDYYGPSVEPEPVGRHAILDFIPMPVIQPFILNLVFSASDHNTIVWNNGTANTDGSVQFANGETQVISHGTLDLGAGKYWLYLIKGNTTLQNTQTFSDTVGADRGIVAIAEKASTATEYASIVSLSGDMFHVGETGVHIAKLSAINADMGLLTAGEIRVGEGTLDDDYTGWRLWVESNVGRMAGYNDGDLMWYSGSDGKFYAAGGKIVIDDEAIHLHAADEHDDLLIFYDDDNDVHGYFIVNEGKYLELEAYGNSVDLRLRSDDGQVRIYAGGSGTDSRIRLDADHIDIAGYFDDDLDPAYPNQLDMGRASNRWDGIYCQDIDAATSLTIGHTSIHEFQLLQLLALI